MWNKKITFYSLVPGLADAYPIILAKNYRPKWVENSRNDCVQKTKEVIVKDFAHVHHCPGIFELFQEGYIVPMWHDLLIETNGDKKSYRWQVPTDSVINWMSDVPLINHHDSAAQFIPYPDNAMKIIMKFNTPWRVITPKDVKLLIMPLSYPDEQKFSSVTGILDPALSNELNIQLFWHAINERVLIKAGTPMLHVIPLTEKKYEMVCRYKDHWDGLWQLKKKFISGSSWTFRRKIVKDAFNNHYKR